MELNFWNEGGERGSLGAFDHHARDRRAVVLHDDGSRIGMYDLRIGSAESPEVAIECVSAVDPIRTETWNVGPARGSFVLQIRGDWAEELEPDANVKQVRKITEYADEPTDSGTFRQIPTTQNRKP